MSKPTTSHSQKALLAAQATGKFVSFVSKDIVNTALTLYALERILIIVTKRPGVEWYYALLGISVISRLVNLLPYAFGKEDDLAEIIHHAIAKATVKNYEHYQDKTPKLFSLVETAALSFNTSFSLINNLIILFVLHFRHHRPDVHETISYSLNFTISLLAATITNTLKFFMVSKQKVLNVIMAIQEITVEWPAMHSLWFNVLFSWGFNNWFDYDNSLYFSAAGFTLGLILETTTNLFKPNYVTSVRSFRNSFSNLLITSALFMALLGDGLNDLYYKGEQNVNTSIWVFATFMAISWIVGIVNVWNDLVKPLNFVKESGKQCYGKLLTTCGIWSQDRTSGYEVINDEQTHYGCC